LDGHACLGDAGTIGPLNREDFYAIDDSWAIPGNGVALRDQPRTPEYGAGRCDGAQRGGSAPREGIWRTGGRMPVHVAKDALFQVRDELTRQESDVAEKGQSRRV
jgi:hypothetical protein